jgi:hypothetical protein
MTNDQLGNDLGIVEALRSKLYLIIVRVGKRIRQEFVQGAILKIGVLCSVVGIFFSLTPLLIGFQALSSGSWHLEEYYRSNDTVHLQQAQLAFQRTIEFLPSEPLAYRRLAQVALLKGEAEQAISALEEAYRLQPNSLLIKQELATAYEHAERFADGQDVWNDLNIGVDQMASFADIAMRHGDTRAAYEWNSRVIRYTASPGQLSLFQRAIAAIMLGESTAEEAMQAAIEADPTLTVGNAGRAIPGAGLRWVATVDHDLTAGTPLVTHTGQWQYGAFWQPGQAVAVVDVPAGSYLLTVHAWHQEQVPLVMGIGMDGQELQQVTLKRGQRLIEKITIPVKLRGGLHTISVWSYSKYIYLNSVSLKPLPRSVTVDTSFWRSL